MKDLISKLTDISNKLESTSQTIAKRKVLVETIEKPSSPAKKYSFKAVFESLSNESMVQEQTHRYTITMDANEIREIKRAVIEGRFEHIIIDVKPTGEVTIGTSNPEKLAADLEEIADAGESSWSEIMGLTEQGDQVTIQPAQQNTQVIKQGDKTLGTVNNPQLAQQIKQSIGKGEMSLVGDEELQEESNDMPDPREVAKQIIDLIDGPPENIPSRIKRSPEPYRATMDYLGYEEYDGSEWWHSVMDSIEDIRDENELLENNDAKLMKRITAGKYGGNDAGSWAVFIDGRPMVTGLTKPEVSYYKKVALKRLQEKTGKGEMSLAGADLKEDGDDLDNSYKIREIAADAFFFPKHKLTVTEFDNKYKNALYTMGYGDRDGTPWWDAVMRDIDRVEAEHYASKHGNTFETTNVTDYNPVSQGGTRKELLAKLAKTGKPEDATRARKAGASQTELKNAYNAHDQKVKTMKKIKESENTVEAARLAGKANALAKELFNCRYDQGSSEASAYLEGYKEGLDQICGSSMGESTPSATVPGMASDELAMPSDSGGFDSDYDDTDAFSISSFKPSDSDLIAFESWDRELNSLLNEGVLSEGKMKEIDIDMDELSNREFKKVYGKTKDEMTKELSGTTDKKSNKKKVTEGMSVTMSKGIDGQSDSVSVTASDSDAESLLNLIKSSNIGMFATTDDAQVSNYGAPVTPDATQAAPTDDSMYGIVQRLSAVNDYEDEQSGEETVDDCDASLVTDKEVVVGEEETEDQLEFNVAEADSEEADSGDEEELDESSHDEYCDACDRVSAECVCDSDDTLYEWANDAGKDGTDTTFEQDIEFMTKVISGGLNKQKKDQTTLPHTKVDINESADSVQSWKILSGIK